MERKEAKTPIGVLRFADDREVKVLGETSRYWLCEGAQFRKNNPQIAAFIPAQKKAKLTKPPEPDAGEREVDTDAQAE